MYQHIITLQSDFDFDAFGAGHHDAPGFFDAHPDDQAAYLAEWHDGEEDGELVSLDDLYCGWPEVERCGPYVVCVNHAIGAAALYFKVEACEV